MSDFLVLQMSIGIKGIKTPSHKAVSQDISIGSDVGMKIKFGWAKYDWNP